MPQRNYYFGVCLESPRTREQRCVLLYAGKKRAWRYCGAALQGTSLTGEFAKSPGGGGSPPGSRVLWWCFQESCLPLHTGTLRGNMYHCAKCIRKEKRHKDKLIPFMQSRDQPSRLSCLASGILFVQHFAQFYLQWLGERFRFVLSFAKT
ncbi:uncharacterized protein LOC144366869 [Ictidomys tridecemlineatus]